MTNQKLAAICAAALFGPSILVALAVYRDALFPLVQTIAPFGVLAAVVVAVGYMIQDNVKHAEERRSARYNREAEERSARYNRDINDFMLLHRRALARRRWQLVQRDDYGNMVTKKWDKERRHFIGSVLVPYLSKLGHAYVPDDKKRREALYESYNALVDGWADQSALNDDIADITTGQEYERFCADLLIANGWDNVRLTKATGDQGADILGESNGLRVVFQCKFYTSPVGNKAVQEAVAARFYERANFAVVISNAAYTPSAETLARTSGTILIHHDDIPSLREP